MATYTVQATTLDGRVRLAIIERNAIGFLAAQLPMAIPHGAEVTLADHADFDGLAIELTSDHAELNPHASRVCRLDIYTSR